MSAAALGSFVTVYAGKQKLAFAEQSETSPSAEQSNKDKPSAEKFPRFENKFEIPKLIQDREQQKQKEYAGREAIDVTQLEGERFSPEDA